MKYSLGPVLYYWPKETLEDFYQQAANCSADTIYLGEAVCSKRRATKVGDWIEMAKTLAASGKHPKDAREMSTQRVFGGVNGMYVYNTFE